MHDIMYNLNNEPLNLENLAKELEERFNKYQKEYKPKQKSSRESRDKQFQKLLTQYKENEKKSEQEKVSSFYQFCKFYVENLNSGFGGRTPEMIRYIRLPLYIAFGLQNLKLTTPYNYRIYSQPPLICSDGDAADVIKKRLYEELKKFCNNFENYKKSEGKLEIG